MKRRNSILRWITLPVIVIIVTYITWLLNTKIVLFYICNGHGIFNDLFATMVATFTGIFVSTIYSPSYKLNVGIITALIFSLIAVTAIVCSFYLGAKNYVSSIISAVGMLIACIYGIHVCKKLRSANNE